MLKKNMFVKWDLKRKLNVGAYGKPTATNGLQSCDSGDVLEFEMGGQKIKSSHGRDRRKSILCCLGRDYKRKT